MKKVFYIFLSRPVTSGMLFITVIILGLVSAFNIPVELSPHAEFPRLSVSVSWSGVSPEAVEAFVTSPVEAEIAGIMGVKKITSRSTEGNCYINLEFHPETDMNFARIEINEKLHSLKDQLPVGVSIPRLSDYIPDELKDLQGFLTYTISGNENASTIRKFAVENMLYPLRAINGVSDVEIRGGTPREIQIIVDYEKSKSLSVTGEEIQNAVMDAEKILSAGSIIRMDEQRFVRIATEIKNIDIIYEQPVKTESDGSIIRLRDITKITDDYKEADSYYRINGKETVTIIISKEPGSNTLAVATNVKNKIAELKNILPAGYEIKKEIDKSETIEEEMRELYSSGLFSLIIIITVLLIIFKSLNRSLIITASIIFSLLFSFTLFYLSELPLNILTISAFILGFGFMVDNSIVVVDYLDKHYKNNGIKYITVLLKNIFYPLFASTFTTLAVFLPLLFLTGELKIYFEQLALGIIFTLFASLIVSFSVVPVFYYKTNKKRSRINYDFDNGLYRKIYLFILSIAVRNRKMIFTIALLLIGLPVWLLPTRIETPVIGFIYNSIFDTEFYDGIKPYTNYIFGGSLNLFFNHINRGEVWQYGESTYLAVRLELPHGNRIERINELTAEFEKEILRYRDQIDYLTANVYDEENSIIKVDFTEEQSHSSFPYMLKNYLTAYAIRMGGLNVSVYGFGPGFYSEGTGSNSFSVVVKGFNYTRTRELAESLRQFIIRNPRIDNVDIDKSGFYRIKDTYEIVGSIERDRLLQPAIQMDYLSSIIAKNTKGNIGYNRFRIDNDIVSYDIRYSNYRNIQLSELENLILQNPDGSWLKVKDVLTFEEKKVLSAINREDQQYVRYVTFDFKGPYRYGSEYVQSSINKMIVPEGYSIKPREFMLRFGDEDEINIWYILGAAVIIIFMITAGLFESFKKPLIIITAIPFALIGTIILFYLGEYNLDRGAYAGILLLIGLSVNNSIILVDYLSGFNVNRNMKRIFELSANRLRPIFTTTITTVAALVPLMLSAESPFWKSLSLSVIGGIVFSSIAVAVMVPILYVRISPAST